jgi:predicted RNA binding protein YcfA (HicA-like mRNA interferase family)
LAKDGWYAVSQKGSHVKMRHETKKEQLYFQITEAKKWVKDWKRKF